MRGGTGGGPCGGSGVSGRGGSLGSTGPPGRTKVPGCAGGGAAGRGRPGLCLRGGSLEGGSGPGAPSSGCGDVPGRLRSPSCPPCTSARPRQLLPGEPVELRFLQPRGAPTKALSAGALAVRSRRCPRGRHPRPEVRYRGACRCGGAGAGAGPGFPRPGGTGLCGLGLRGAPAAGSCGPRGSLLPAVPCGATRGSCWTEASAAPHSRDAFRPLARLLLLGLGARPFPWSSCGGAGAGPAPRGPSSPQGHAGSWPRPLPPAPGVSEPLAGDIDVGSWLAWGRPAHASSQDAGSAGSLASGVLGGSGPAGVRAPPAWATWPVRV